MAHEVVKMAYRGETPWHGLGFLLSDDATFDAWLRESGLTFRVRGAKVQFDSSTNDTPAIRGFNDKQVLFREDNGQPLGIVSASKYKIVQPDQILEFYRDFVRAGDMKLETAGVLKKGRRVWALARHGMEIRIKGQDLVRPYFLLTTSYDGETGTNGMYVMERVVCANTLAAAYYEFDDKTESDGSKRVRYSSTGFSVPHTTEFDINAAKEHARKLATAAVQYEEESNRLADRPMTTAEVMAYFTALVGVKNINDNDMTRQSRTKVDRLLTLYQSGPGADLRSSKDTLFGALNAVTRFVDHEAAARSSDGRLMSAWYGNGRDLKNRARKVALALAA